MFAHTCSPPCRPLTWPDGLALDLSSLALTHAPPRPEGLLTIEVVEAEAVPRMDWFGLSGATAVAWLLQVALGLLLQAYPQVPRRRSLHQAAAGGPAAVFLHIVLLLPSSRRPVRQAAAGGARALQDRHQEPHAEPQVGRDLQRHRARQLAPGKGGPAEAREPELGCVLDGQLTLSVGCGLRRPISVGVILGTPTAGRDDGVRRCSWQAALAVI